MGATLTLANERKVAPIKQRLIQRAFINVGDKLKAGLEQGTVMKGLQFPTRKTGRFHDENDLNYAGSGLAHI